MARSGLRVGLVLRENYGVEERSETPRFEPASFITQRGKGN